MLMCRYQRRLSIATSALEKQNLELELARHLVENDAITRNKLIQSSAWAMQTAQKKFNIEEKLRSGCLKESDLHRQQLLALSLHYNQGNGWLTQLGRVLSLYPNNDASTRELLDNMLTDENHPIKVALYSMQHNIMNLVQAPTSVEGSLPNTPRTMESIAKVIREDLSVILDVLKALFDPLNNDRNALIASEVVNHFYFSHLKTSIISFLRHEMSDVEARFAQRVQTNNEVFCSLPENVESEAINKLHYLSTLHNPHEMLDCAVFIVKLLATSKFEHEHATSMGADDLLPRLCQVLVASGLVEICAEAAFMEMFIPSEKALGEEGYALTMLQSSIAHLTSDSSR